MKRTITFTAKDGTTFESVAACKAYENTTLIVDRLVNLSETDIAAALGRQDVGLADAIELAGKIIANKRRKNGEMRRKAKTPNAKG